MALHPASKCLFCDISGNYPLTNTCSVCFDTLERLPHCCRKCALPLPEAAEICGQCQKAPPGLNQIHAACPYDRGLDLLIRQFKDSGDFSPLNLFVALLEERLQRTGFQPPDILLPIPMHPLKRLVRGFNQTHLLAEKLGNRLNIDVIYNALGRRVTTDQRTLSVKNRSRNMRRAFFLKNDSLEGLRVALIDDVMTTGATLNSAAKTLNAGGALRVDAWVLARTLIH